LRDFPAGLLPAVAVCSVIGTLVCEREVAVARTDPALCEALCRGAVVAALVLAARATRRPAALACAALVLALGLGGHGMAVRQLRAARDAPAVRFDAGARGRVCDARAAVGFVVVELCELQPLPVGAREPSAHGLPGRARLLEATDSPEGAWLATLSRGDEVRAWLRFEAIPPARNPGERDLRREAARHGLGARARLVDARLALRLPSRSPTAALRRWRRALGERMAAGGEGGPLLAALALGDRRFVREGTRDAFRRLGVSHLLAVSGLHLGGVAGALFLVARRALRARPRWVAGRDVRRASAVLAASGSLAYALLAGWGIPVRRAWIFVLVLTALFVVRRTPRRGVLLAAAGLVIVLTDPAAVFDLGAQLSFAATAALLLAVPMASRAGVGAAPGLLRAAVGSALAASLRVSSTAIVATAPVLAAHGLSSTPVGLAANVLAVPLATLLLLPLAAVGAVAAACGEIGPLEAVLELCAALAGGVVRGAESVASALPPVQVGLPAVPVAVALAGVGAGLALRARSTPARVSICLAVCLGLAGAPARREGPDPPRVVAFAVGQGDAVLVQGRGATMLVDAGWASPGVPGLDLGRSVIAPGLRALGVQRIDLLVASHGDADHRGGLEAVLEAFEVAELWLPAVPDDRFARLESRAAQAGVRVRRRAAGDPAWQQGDVRVETLWPPVGSGRFVGNDASLVLRASVAGRRVLLTGDVGAAAERALLRAPEALQAEILKVGHHGSSGSSTDAFLEAVGFELALVSAPCSVHRTLPAPDALARLARAGGSTWWTGRDGAVVVDWESPTRTPVTGTLRGVLTTRTTTRTWGWSPESRCETPGAAR
jgi:competence protein ComEC